MPNIGVWTTAWWQPVLFLVIAGHLTNACVSLFLHRSQTHNSVKIHRLAALPMRLWLWLSTAINTKEWVACHRKHHAFADRQGDPHSPFIEGLYNVVFRGYFYYRKAVLEPGILEKYGEGTPTDWIERHLVDRRNWLGVLTMLTLDVFLFGFVAGALVWVGQMVWITSATATSTSRASASTSCQSQSGWAARNCTTTITRTRTRPNSRPAGLSSTSDGLTSGCCPCWASPVYSTPPGDRRLTPEVSYPDY